MDGFAGYNENKMDIDDQEKATFNTQWDTCGDNVISLGLTNMEIPYKRTI